MDVKLLWLTFLFVSIMPLRTYLLEQVAPGSYRFYKSCGVFAFIRSYRLRTLSYFLSVVIHSIGWIIGVAAVLVAVLLAVAGIRSLLG